MKRKVGILLVVLVALALLAIVFCAPYVWTDRSEENPVESLLGELRCPTLIDEVTEYIGLSQGTERRDPFEIIDDITGHGVEAIPALLDALEKGQPKHKLYVPFALAAIKKDPDGRVTATLLALLGDEDPDIRRSAVRALGDMGHPRRDVVAALSESLRKDKTPKVRACSALALGKLRPTSHAIVRTLSEELSDGHEDVRCHAALG